jgi:hypothetical protein
MRQPETVSQGMTARFHRAPQVSFVQFTRRFLALLAGFNVEMAIIDVAIPEDLKYPWATVACHLKGIVLAEPARRVRQADTLYEWCSHNASPPG